mmetsp:Transcript_82082/g.183111  ORF Transcript_82082/g.183111 Transcript_82082/m.183111 type:complete len:439 (+) Transcript_82082:3-1319(+)
MRYKSRRTESEVRRCKKGQRTDIKPPEWDKFGYASNNEVLERGIVYDSQTLPIRRLRRCDITQESFYKDVVLKNQPVIIEGAVDHWPAMRRWSIDALEEKYRHVSFKVGKTDGGKNIKIKFKYYADYLRRQKDDSPLYLFETGMDDDGHLRHLLDDFEIPDLFPNDWFALMNEDARPPHRWFCIGPKRSGTTVHTDPLGTSAWNAVTHGRKQWVLFEPDTPRRIAKGKDVLKKGEDNEAIMYFDFLLPRLKRANPNVRTYEGVQNPGELIFVPGDWWHGVLNLEDAVAATQNYCGPDNFEKVWTRTRRQREKVASLWLRNMRKFAPSLHARALEMNRRDGFRMRHERKKGEKLPQSDSSSDSSSSDSSSDEAADLCAVGVESILGSGVVLGAAARKRRAPTPCSASALPVPAQDDGGSWKLRRTKDNFETKGMAPLIG